jgi:hypothetical protein
MEYAVRAKGDSVKKALLIGAGGVVVVGALGYLVYRYWGGQSDAAVPPPNPNSVAESFELGLQDDQSVSMTMTGVRGSREATVTLQPFMYRQTTGSTTPSSWAIYGGFLPVKWVPLIAPDVGIVRFDIPFGAITGDAVTNSLFQGSRTPTFDMVMEGENERPMFSDVGVSRVYIKFQARPAKDYAGNAAAQVGFASYLPGTVKLTKAVTFKYTLAEALA